MGRLWLWRVTEFVSSVHMWLLLLKSLLSDTEKFYKYTLRCSNLKNSELLQPIFIIQKLFYSLKEYTKYIIIDIFFFFYFFSHTFFCRSYRIFELFFIYQKTYLSINKIFCFDFRHVTIRNQKHQNFRTFLGNSVCIHTYACMSVSARIWIFRNWTFSENIVISIFYKP